MDLGGGPTFRDAMHLKKIKVHSRKPERRRSGVQSKEARHVEVSKSQALGIDFLNRIKTSLLSFFRPSCSCYCIELSIF